MAKPKSTTRSRGRPTRLTFEVQDRICTALRTGASIEVAAHHVGVAKDTVYGWLARGEREGDGAHAAFAEAVHKALADCQLANLAVIRKAALGGDTRAAMFLLERRFPDSFGRRDHHHINADVKQTVSHEDARRELESLLDRLPQPGAAALAVRPPEPGGGGEARD